MSGSLCHQGNLIVTARQNNLPAVYLYRNSFFMRDVHGEFGSRNVHLFNVYFLQFRLEKSGIFFCLESGDPVRQHVACACD